MSYLPNGFFSPPPVYYLDPAADERRALRREGQFIGVGMLLLTGLQMTLASVVLIVLMLFGVVGADALSDTYWGLGNTAFLLVYMAIYIVMMGVPMWFAALCFGVRRNPFAMHAPVKPARFAAAVMLGLGGSVVANLIAGAWSNLWSLFGVELPYMDDYVEKSVLSLLLNIVVFAVLPALLEEMVFRGFILGGLRRMGDPAALFISSLLFGLMHMNMLQFPFAFLLGLLMGWLTLKTGNIWVAVTIHFLNNAMASIVGYVGLFVGDANEGIVTVALFVILALLAMVVLAVLLCVRSPLVTPLENTRTHLLPKERQCALWGAPCFWIAAVAFALLTLVYTFMM